MAKCSLDFSHPSFKKALKDHKNDAAFNDGLNAAKAKIEAEHTSCHRVVQRMGPMYPECHRKIWKYDWAPENQTGSSRKSCRMVVIVPEPDKQPLELKAAGIYYKSEISQLSDKQLAAIFAEIAGPRIERVSSLKAEDFKFNEIKDSQGVIHAVCLNCATMVIESGDYEEVAQAEIDHECEQA